MHAVFLLVFFENGPASLLYTYTHSHLGAAQHDHSLPLLASEEFLWSWWGLIVLLKGISMGIVEEGGACFSLTSLSGFSQPFGETEPATSVKSFFSLHGLFCLHE